MPGHDRFQVSIRGSEEWGRAVDDLARRLGLRGRSEVVLHALAALARAEGIDLPRRTRPHGTNQFGEPRRRSEG